MSEIVLATLNARYAHCAFGLRYLFANMGDLQPKTAMLEFTIQQPTLEILDAILARQPAIVGLGIYIWNVAETTRLIADLKRVRPDIVVVIGGPEVSYEVDQQEICRLADFVICGEADLEFARFCRRTLQMPGCDRTAADSTAVGVLNSPQTISAPLPNPDDLALPYDFYVDEDIAHRTIYVEASRGCPFTCEFCLSALDIPVRQFPLDRFLAAMDSLLQRGARQFKFVDRTFNLNLRVGRTILQFFLDRIQPGMFLHFEMIPDRLPESLKELISQFPAGALQFEVGIQTFDEDVCRRISRGQENLAVEQNLRWLREDTGVHVHADLIVGLPGETLESFAIGFDRLVRLGPQEIQVGILKRLRGTPIVRHDRDWQMIYSPHPPYEILSTKTMDFSVVQELRRFAKLWDTIANSGNFVETLPMLWRRSDGQSLESDDDVSTPSPFDEFRQLAGWLFERERTTHGIPLGRLIERVFHYLTEIKQLPQVSIAAALWRDYQRGGRNDKPHCLRPYIDAFALRVKSQTTPDSGGPMRQARHRIEKQPITD